MNQTQTVGRALDILFALAESGSALTVKEIAEKVSIPASTVYRLIRTLELNDVVTRKAHGEISLGVKLFQLAQSLYKQFEEELLMVSSPFLNKLTKSLNETSFLAVRRGDEGITVKFVEGNRLIRFVTHNGKSHALTEGATGKSILAFEEETFIHKIISETENGSTNLLKELQTIRVQGYAKTVGEVDEDTLAVAAPIYNPSNRVIASITVAGPKDRFNEQLLEKTITEVQFYASQITYMLKQGNI